MYTRQIGGKVERISSDGKAKLHVHLVGPHPILQHFIDRMDFCNIVRRCLGTPRDGLLDYAETLAILVQNIILSPAPLYRIAEWASPIDPAALGITQSQKLSLNDDRVARALDALASPRGRSLFFSLALHIIKTFELETKRIHHDTTTVTFHGAYKTSVRSPRIAHGINKDHRPDLKQLVFGLNVTADGAVPISHQIRSGNRTDDTIHCDNVDRLRHLLGHDEFIYVADSKLCTRKNLGHIAGYGGKFVTVMPRTRAEDKRFRKRLREGEPVRWRRLLELPSKRRKSEPPDVYWTTADGPTQTTEGYRILWYRSSQKAQLDRDGRLATIRKAETELVNLDARLNRRKLKRPSAIRAAVKQLLQSHNCGSFLQVKVRSTVHTELKRLRPGRPRKADPVRTIRTKSYALKVRRNLQALKAEARADGVFPLLTNLRKAAGPKKAVLLIYKYQPYIEKRHALLKTELEVAPVYIKKPERAVGLIHASFLAMMLDALIERSLRLAMRREDIDSLPILPEGRPTKSPTTARLLEIFSGASWYEAKRDGQTTIFPMQLTKLQTQLLRLLSIDRSAYA
jgi:transposase